MSTVFLMCGLTFSGKTTVAKRIASEFGCEYISLDEINDERGLWGWSRNRGRGLGADTRDRSHTDA